MKNRSVIIIILAFLVVVFGLLCGRLFFLQFCRSRYYRQSSQRQQHAIIAERPQRGIILDRCGRILAASNRIETVFAEPAAVADVKEAAIQLQRILGMPGHEICDIIYKSKNPGFVRIKSDITAEQRDAINKAGIFGVGIQTSWQRYYPMNSLASHLLGFVGTEQKGLAGVEFQYDRKLRGSQGRDVLVLDVMRRPIGRKPVVEVVRDGSGLILTIDATIQQFVRTALMKQYLSYEAESAVAIAMEPSTGAILGLVSLPDFEPADFGSTDPQQLKNRVLTDPFEPGSIFKPIATAIALDSGAIDFDEKFFCEDGYYRGKGFGTIHEFRDHKFGDLTVCEILQQSSNIGMAKIGQKMGKQKLYEGLKHFGFGAKTGVDLPGEEAGLLWPVEKWTGYSVTRIPYGYEINVTAMQVIRAYCILANGGRPVRPYVLRAIVDNSGEVTECQQRTNLTGYVIKPEVAHWIVRQALTGVVTDGTGKRAAIEGVEVFGKTGTADIARTDRKGYGQRDNTASFVGGAPAENPAVVVLVSIRKPDKALGKGSSGGIVAAPVVGEILDKTLTYLQKR